MAGKAKNEEGNIYGRLTVVSRAFVKNETVYWTCECTCGVTLDVCGSSLRRSKRPTKSCGCAQVEVAKVLHLTVDNTKHSRSDLWLATVRHHVRIGAKSRGIQYSLGDDQLRSIASSSCHYCGVQPSNYIQVARQDLKTVIYQGVDRIDSSNGYLPDNVRPCCKDCNRAKAELSDQNFKNLIARIYNHMLETQDVI